MTVYNGDRKGPSHWGPRLTVVDEQRWGPFPRTYHCFEWGYGGTGPGDLAAFMLEQHSGSRPSRELWMAFKFAVIADLPRDAPWTLTTTDIQTWLDSGVLPKTFPKLGNTEGIGHGAIRLRVSA